MRARPRTEKCNKKIFFGLYGAGERVCMAAGKGHAEKILETTLPYQQKTHACVTHCISIGIQKFHNECTTNTLHIRISFLAGGRDPLRQLRSFWDHGGVAVCTPARGLIWRTQYLLESHLRRVQLPLIFSAARIMPSVSVSDASFGSRRTP